MPSHLQIFIPIQSVEEAEIFISILEDAPYYAFETVQNYLHAYILSQDFDPRFLEKNQISYTVQEMADTNWNQQWEQNYDPVIIDHRLRIRADFHPPSTGSEMEIIINPKMSFGTGHHATTSMMARLMLHSYLQDKCVLDFGTGTGVLSILSEKLGARHVVAVDNDPNCIENSRENIERNQCRNIEVALSERPDATDRVDIILANIQLNVLLQYRKDFERLLSPRGLLFLSGVLVENEDALAEAFSENFKIEQSMQSGRWIAGKWIRTGGHDSIG